jgi:hypothetical protein
MTALIAFGFGECLTSWLGFGARRSGIPPDGRAADNGKDFTVD